MNQRLHHILITASVLLAAASLSADEPPPLWETRDYAYDGTGNIMAAGSETYRYDGVGRLKRATTGAGADRQEYAYDIHGNITSVSTVTAAGTTFVNGYAVNAGTNQLNGVCPSGVDVCFEGRYDNAGNQMRRDQNASLPAQYQWDALNMMREQQTLRQERYIYDSNDERVLIVERPGGIDARRRYTLRGAGNKVVRELVHDVAANTWTLARDYVHRGDTVIASFSGTGAAPNRHYHPDHLGSTRLITDKDGFPAARHAYWPFGVETESSDADDERVKFTGHERDSLPGSPGFDLDYMHARYYDPSVGRFLSVDPGVDSDPRFPQSWNLFTYVRNEPVNRVDPSGRNGKRPPMPSLPNPYYDGMVEANRPQNLFVGEVGLGCTLRGKTGLKVVVDVVSGTVKIQIGTRNVEYKINIASSDGVDPSLDSVSGKTNGGTKLTLDSLDNLKVSIPNMATVGPNEVAAQFDGKAVSAKLGVRPRGLGNALAWMGAYVKSSWGIGFTRALMAQYEAMEIDEQTKQEPLRDDKHDPPAAQ